MRGLGPQFVGVLAVAYDTGEVVAAVALSEGGDGRSQVALFLGLQQGSGHDDSWVVCGTGGALSGSCEAAGASGAGSSVTTASRAPTST